MEKNKNGIDSIIDALETEALNALGLRSILAMITCLYSGDSPTDETAADAFSWLCCKAGETEDRLNNLCIKCYEEKAAQREQKNKVGMSSREGATEI